MTQITLNQGASIQLTLIEGSQSSSGGGTSGAGIDLVQITSDYILTNDPVSGTTLIYAKNTTDAEIVIPEFGNTLEPGRTFLVNQDADAPISVVFDSGVTVEAPTVSTLTLSLKGSLLRLVYLGDDNWRADQIVTLATADLFQSEFNAARDAAEVSANNAAGSEAGALGALDSAQAVLESVLIGADGVYGTTANGIAGTVLNDRFIVANTVGWQLFKHDTGSIATPLSGVFSTRDLLNVNAAKIKNLETITLLKDAVEIGGLDTDDLATATASGTYSGYKIAIFNKIMTGNSLVDKLEVLADKVGLVSVYAYNRDLTTNTFTIVSKAIDIPVVAGYNNITAALSVPAGSYIGVRNGTGSSGTIATIDGSYSPRIWLAPNENPYVRNTTESSTKIAVKVTLQNYKSALKDRVDAIEAATSENTSVTALLFPSLTDYFLVDGVSVGALTITGQPDPSQTNWRTTPFVRATPGQSFAYESNLGGTGSSQVGFVCAYDADKNFIVRVLEQGGSGDQIVVMPAGTAFVRASIAITVTPYHFLGYDLSRNDPIVIPPAELPEVTISALAPDQAYAKVGETLYMYSEGIIADDSVSRAWNFRETNAKVFSFAPTTTSDIPIQLKAYDALGTEQTVADFNIKVTGTPVSPATAQNIICIGDSLTNGVSDANIQGAYVNEFSRRLTGIGTELLTGAVSPAPLDLSNIFFRGTLGNQAVKHEGRDGWSANMYLTRGDSPFMFDGSFDFGQYLTSNGFDDGNVATGVNSTGSNLTCYILLGWNDVYNSGAAFSATKMTELINGIKATRPDTKFVLVGLNPAPTVNFKFFTGTRFVSKRRVFEDSVKAFGLEWKAIAAALTNVEYLQISHVMNAEQSYGTTSKRISARSTATIAGAVDHVHPGKIGYCFIADACYYNFLYRECR